MRSFFKNCDIMAHSNPSFWLHSKVGSKEPQIFMSSIINEKKVKPIGNGTSRWGKGL